MSAEEERAAVVAYLRSKASEWLKESRRIGTPRHPVNWQDWQEAQHRERSYRAAAHAIERGEHLKQEKPDGR